MTRVVLIGAGFENLDPAGTSLARGEVEIVRIGPEEDPCPAANVSAPCLVIVDTRSVGDRASSILETVRASAGSASVLFVVPGLEREQWETAGADGIVNRPLTAARLLDALRKHLPIDERADDRSEEVLKVELASREADWTGFTRDVGVSGAFVHGSPPFSPGDEVTIRFSLLGDPEGDPVEGGATVVRAERGPAGEATGIALRFTGLSASDRGRLGRWLRARGRGPS